jgi:hypothetical protein
VGGRGGGIPQLELVGYGLVLSPLFLRFFLRKTQNFKIIKNWSAKYIVSLQNFNFFGGPLL